MKFNPKTPKKLLEHALESEIPDFVIKRLKTDITTSFYLPHRISF
jgi:hypothetical protein